MFLFPLFLGKLRILLKLLFLVGFLFISVSSLSDNIFSDFTQIFNKEISVYNNDADIETALNGRIGSWIIYFNDWLELGSVNFLFGSGIHSRFYGQAGMLRNAMGDFSRILFTTGIIGFISYLCFFITIFFKRKKFIYASVRF